MKIFKFGAMFGAAMSAIVQSSENAHGPWATISRANLITNPDLEGLGYRYASDSESWDTWRYAGKSNFPLTVQFMDGDNVFWRVSIESSWDELKMCVPSDRRFYFRGHGTDSDNAITTDANVRWSCFQFSYQGSSWFHSHGIRMKTRGYADSSDTITSLIENWSQIVKVVGETADTGTKIIDMVGSGVDTGAKIAALGKR